MFCHEPVAQLGLRRVDIAYIEADRLIADLEFEELPVGEACSGGSFCEFDLDKGTTGFTPPVDFDLVGVVVSVLELGLPRSMAPGFG